MQKCDPALPRAAAVHGPSDGAGGLDVLHGGEHGDAKHGDGGHEQHRDERQFDEGLANADKLSSCLSRSYLLFNPGAHTKLFQNCFHKTILEKNGLISKELVLNLKM